MKIWKSAQDFGRSLRRACKLSILPAACALLLGGCAGTTEATLSTEADGSVRIGSILKISSWPEALALYDSKDALAAEGLYYASWTSGQSSKYTNEDGAEIDLYPVQVTLLGAERKDTQSAQDEIEIWKSASGDNYAVSDTRRETVGGQEYEILTYTMKNPDSPWKGGVSAFGVHGPSAVCVEVTYQEAFEGDPGQLLMELLGDFSYLN